MMYVALTYDHRIIDGREAVQFLVAVKESLEDPSRLLLQVEDAQSCLTVSTSSSSAAGLRAIPQRSARPRTSRASPASTNGRTGTEARFRWNLLNAGCIPSKALLESTELYHRAQHEFAAHGVKIDGLGFDVPAMQKRKGGIVRQMTQGILGLFKAAGVTPLSGHGRLLPGRKVEFTGSDGAKRTLQAKHVVLASGSEPMPLRGVEFDGKQIVDSWGALEFAEVPKRLCVIGAGVIGLELGSVWRRLGAETVVLEALEQFLPIADGALAKEALRHFKKLGLDIRLGAKVSGTKVGKDGVQVSYADASGNQTLVVDRVIVAIGRRPFSKDLLADGTGVVIDPRGFIQVDDHCRTGALDAWAVGDCVRGPMLAHKGKEEGVAVADRIAGLYGEVNYKVIPSVIYTAPEIAWVGQTEEQAKAAGRAARSAAFPLPRAVVRRRWKAAQASARL